MGCVMRVAVCDSSAADTGLLERLIGQCAAAFGVSVQCECYLSPVRLYSDIMRGYRHFLYILQMEMPQMSGMRLARAIRGHDQNAVIIFVAAHTEWMREAFDVCAFHFILLPLEEKIVLRVLYRAFEYILQGRLVFLFHQGRKNYAVNLGQVIYFQSFGRKVTVFMETEEIEYYGQLKKVLNCLGNGRFVQINKSNVINMGRIGHTDYQEVVMLSGERLPVTNSYRQHFYEVYLNYIQLYC